jgi:hypothetical protein
LTLEECKIQASILFKSLPKSLSKSLTETLSKPLQKPLLVDAQSSPQDSSSNNALKRFHRCPETREIPTELLKLKHALAVIAFEKGFRSWEELKLQTEGDFLSKRPKSPICIFREISYVRRRRDDSRYDF